MTAPRFTLAVVAAQILVQIGGFALPALLPGYIDVELLEARGLLPPLTPEAADLEGTGPHFDLASVSRMRDQFAVHLSHRRGGVGVPVSARREHRPR